MLPFTPKVTSLYAFLMFGSPCFIKSIDRDGYVYMYIHIPVVKLPFYDPTPPPPPEIDDRSEACLDFNPCHIF